MPQRSLLLSSSQTLLLACTIMQLTTTETRTPLFLAVSLQNRTPVISEENGACIPDIFSLSTPLVQIAAFQGHHRFPWTITARPVSNNLYRLTLPTLPQVLLLLSFAPAGPLTAFYGTFLAGIVGAQEAHRQAHMTRAAPWVRALQNRGILLPQRMHAAHHRGANEGNYCILSGMWNKQLDRSGFFRRLEAVIYKATDVEPICWGLDPKLKEEAMGLLPILWR